jgi:glycine cleavage system aminomethyltransferase T
MSTLEFLAPVATGADVVARSPMEALGRSAGGRFEVRDGFDVAVSYPAASYDDSVSWCDTSHLPKLQLQGTAKAIDAAAGTALEAGTAVRRGGAWWCRLTGERALVIGARPSLSDGELELVDMTSMLASLTVSGPLARECFARFCALDLRPSVMPVAGFRPGSVARTPGFVLREAPTRYLALVGAAVAGSVWEIVADAATHLGGRPVGVDALAAAAPVDEEVEAHA